MRAGRTRAALLSRIERLESRAAAVRPMRVRFVGKPPGWGQPHGDAGAPEEFDKGVGTVMEVVFVRAPPAAC